jgi:hypothetical protein
MITPSYPVRALARRAAMRGAQPRTGAHGRGRSEPTGHLTQASSPLTGLTALFTRGGRRPPLMPFLASVPCHVCAAGQRIQVPPGWCVPCPLGLCGSEKGQWPQERAGVNRPGRLCGSARAVSGGQRVVSFQSAGCNIQLRRLLEGSLLLMRRPCARPPPAMPRHRSCCWLLPRLLLLAAAAAPAAGRAALLLASG